MTNDENTLKIPPEGQQIYFTSDSKLDVFRTDPMGDIIKAAMEDDGTEIADSDRSGIRARIDFAQNGTMYVLFPASGIVRRYRPDQ